MKDIHHGPQKKDNYPIPFFPAETRKDYYSPQKVNPL